MRHLADLALDSPHLLAPHVAFTSSVGTLSSWAETGSVPEEPIDNPEVAVGNGYGESKWVSERVRHELRFLLNGVVLNSDAYRFSWRHLVKEACLYPIYALGSCPALV